MTADKQSKLPLSQIVMIERMKGRTPLVRDLLGILERVLDGDQDASALDLLAEHGTPAMLSRAGDAGLLQPAHWEAWKARMTPVEAEIVLKSEEGIAWPHEVREWAAVIAVSRH